MGWRATLSALLAPQGDEAAREGFVGQLSPGSANALGQRRRGRQSWAAAALSRTARPRRPSGCGSGPATGRCASGSRPRSRDELVPRAACSMMVMWCTLALSSRASGRARFEPGGFHWPEKAPASPVCGTGQPTPGRSGAASAPSCTPGAEEVVDVIPASRVAARLLMSSWTYFVRTWASLSASMSSSGRDERHA